MEIDQVLLVQEAERRAAPRRRRLPAPAAGRPHRRGRLHGVGGARRRSPSSRARARRCACAGRYIVHPRFGPQINLRELAAARRRAATRRATCSTVPRAPVEQMEAEIRELIATIQEPHLRDAARARVRRGLAAVGALPRARRPPSTTTRPTATACSSTASASPRRSARSARRSRGSTATSRSPARCCTTSASSRPTRT